MGAHSCCYGAPARRYVLVPDQGFMQSWSVRHDRPASVVGRRIVVTGMAGAGKSTFSRALSAKTRLPVIHLDLHFWKPGWAEPSEDEWREKQRGPARRRRRGSPTATTTRRSTIALSARTRLCSWIRRAGSAPGARSSAGFAARPVGFQLPEGCDQSARRRLRDEWLLAGRICRVRRSERATRTRKSSRGTGNHVATRSLLVLLRPRGG